MILSPSPIRRLALAALLCGIALQGRAALAAQIAARAGVERQEVYVGEPFLFQIQILGSDAPEAPDVAALKDFDVQALGGRPNNSESVTIINGKMDRVVRRAYVFSYHLTAKQPGQFTIPAIAVTAEGVQLSTNPVPVRAVRPTETEDSKLRLTLDKPRCYVGEPVVLTITWYLGRAATNAAFQLPILADPSFASDDVEVQIDDRRKFAPGRIGDKEIALRRGTGTLDGREYTTYTFQKILIPRRPGDFTLPPATVVCGLKSNAARPTNPFDDFFARDEYERVVVPSDTPTLHVLELPAAGCPANFTGLVGPYRIEASAAPLEASVGDPITLTLRLSGPPYLKNADLPPLKDQPALARDFKIPEERAEGKIDGGVKVFTQTLRALRPDVSSVPPIELPYFDTESGTYHVAKTKPIPLIIRAAKIVTAGDIEGRDATGVQSELTSRIEGIAHNYEDLGVLDRQPVGIASAFRDPLWLSLVGLPFLAYLTVAVTAALRRRSQADPAAALARRALRDLNRELGSLKPLPPEGLKPSGGYLLPGSVLQAFRNYLGKKLRLAPPAITWGDVEPLLRPRSIPAETLLAVQDLFRQCEASHYAGAQTAETPADLAKKARNLAKALERSLITLLLLCLFFVPRSACPTVQAEEHTAGQASRGTEQGPGTEPGAGLSREQIVDLFSEAKDLFRKANDATAAHNPAAAKDLYQTAALRLECLAGQGGIRNGSLFYDIGNIYFRMGDLGRAILYYHRAELLTPNDPNLRQNLDHARRQRTDKIDVKPQTQVLKTLFFWHYDLTLSARLYLFAAFFGLIWLLALVRRFAPRPGLGWGIVLSAIVAALLLGSLLVQEAQRRTHTGGVVLASEIVARKGDGETYQPSFEEPLHAGTEFDVVEVRRDWLFIELSDGRRCWVPGKAVGLIEEGKTG